MSKIVNMSMITGELAESGLTRRVANSESPQNGRWFESSTLRHIVFALFLVGQLLDGLLTYAGMTAGYLEGNPIASYVMSVMGVTAALWTLKLVSCAFGAVLWKFDGTRQLIFVTVLVWTFAVATWTGALLGVW